MWKFMIIRKEFGPPYLYFPFYLFGRFPLNIKAGYVDTGCVPPPLGKSTYGYQIYIAPV